jgi:2-methylcitrate dehydratase PrpD
MADTFVNRLATFAGATASRPLPEELARGAKRSLLDILGVALAARSEDPSRIALEVMAGAGDGEEATVLASGRRLPVSAAAMVNGTMAHALDFDDTHLPSVLHPSASVVPAVLAAAESFDASGAEVLAAIAVGNEITCRLGMAAYDAELRNSIFFEHGMHATSICGTVGSAAAVAVVLGAPEVAAHAMGIATSMGAGLLEANRTGGSVKRIHCGWAAHGGVTAAKLAVAGLTGPPTVLEGRFGFFVAYSEGRIDEEALIGDLGERWEAARLFTKPYPTNHFTHAGIDAALALRDRGVVAEDIVAIDLGVPAPVLRTIAQPPEEKAKPQTGYHGKFSGPFTVAAALVGGRLRDGSGLEHRVRHTRGGPENPLSDEEHALKFRLNAEPVIGPERTEEAIAAVTDIETLGNVRELMRLVG